MSAKVVELPAFGILLYTITFGLKLQRLEKSTLATALCSHAMFVGCTVNASCSRKTHRKPIKHTKTKTPHGLAGDIPSRILDDVLGLELASDAMRQLGILYRCDDDGRVCTS